VFLSTQTLAVEDMDRALDVTRLSCAREALPRDNLILEYGLIF